MLPSPTTGTFPLVPLNHDSSMLSSLTAEDGGRCSDVGSSFKFMPYGDPNFPSRFSSFQEQVNCLLLFILYVCCHRLCSPAVRLEMVDIYTDMWCWVQVTPLNNFLSNVIFENPHLDYVVSLYSHCLKNIKMIR